MADPAPPAADPWHKGVEAEMIGHWQNRGLALDDPKTIALEMTKAHREATAKLGVPAEQLLRMPKADAPEAEVKAFWNRLGAPADPKEYDFGSVKYADGTDLEAPFADALRGVFAARHVPKDTAIEITKALAKFADGDEATIAADRTARLNQEKADLSKSWGTNHDRFKFAAGEARAALQSALQIPNEKMAEVVNALENAYGYANTMKMFHLISTKIGEDKFVAGGGGGNAPMSREQAIARKADLMKDAAWGSRYMAGDTAARGEMLNLNRIITGDFESAA